MSTRKLEKTNVPGLRRDPATGAVLNTERGEYLAAVEKRRMARRIVDLEREVASLWRAVRELQA